MTETVKLITPIDGSVYAERPIATDKAVDAAVETAKQAQADWAQTSIAERGRFCLAALDALLAMNDEIVPEIAWQMGRPVRYGGEKGGVEERTRYMVRIAEHGARTGRRERQAGVPPLHQARTAWRRHGHRAVELPLPHRGQHHHPGADGGQQRDPEARGADAASSASAFAQAFEKAGLPKGVFQNIVLSHGQTEKLLGSGRIDHVNFTGSVGGGRAIEKAAAGTFMTLGLELGGKDPAYVLPDVNLDHAVANLVDGAFFNSGQCCCGIERIYVHENVYDRFVDGFIDLTRQYVVGNPLDAATTMGPMAQTRFADLVREQKAEALRKGAKAHVNMSVCQ